MGILNGVGGEKFEPDRKITRAEFAAIATRFAKATGGKVTFKDVPENYWAADNIATAFSYGWINGYGDNTFRPKNNITRAEAATIVNHMLNRAADQAYITAHSAEIKQFTDLQDATKWYYLDMVEASNGHDYNRSNNKENWTELREHDDVP